jgi:hypothetical protein
MVCRGRAQKCCYFGQGAIDIDFGVTVLVIHSSGTVAHSCLSDGPRSALATHYPSPFRPCQSHLRSSLLGVNGQSDLGAIIH